VLKKNAVECGERTLLAFSDRRGMGTGMGLGMGMGMAMVKGACTWDGWMANKMNVVWQSASILKC